MTEKLVELHQHGHRAGARGTSVGTGHFPLLGQHSAPPQGRVLRAPCGLSSERGTPKSRNY